MTINRHIRFIALGGNTARIYAPVNFEKTGKTKKKNFKSITHPSSVSEDYAYVDFVIANCYFKLLF